MLSFQDFWIDVPGLKNTTYKVFQNVMLCVHCSHHSHQVPEGFFSIVSTKCRKCPQLLNSCSIPYLDQEGNVNNGYYKTYNCYLCHIVIQVVFYEDLHNSKVK